MSIKCRRMLLHSGLIAVLVFCCGLLLNGIALAHVTVNPGQAAKGSYTKVAFRVPNESRTAGTVTVAVTLPTEYQIRSVRTKQIPGWQATLSRTKIGDAELVNTITWQAHSGVRINPDEFAEFEVSLGKLPDTDKLVFPTVQTYDDGKVVRWMEAPRSDGGEPENPAPVLTLSGLASDGHDHGADSNQTGPQEHALSSQQASPASGDNAARWLGGAGLAVGSLALGFAIGALLRNRQNP